MVQTNTVERKSTDQALPPIFGNMMPGPGGPAQRFVQEKKRAKNTRGTLRRIWAICGCSEPRL